MKVSELKRILEEVIKKHGDVDVAVIDIEGDLIPLVPQVVIDEETHAVGINSDFHNEAKNWAGNKAEWTEESWQEFKETHTFKDC